VNPLTLPGSEALTAIRGPATTTNHAALVMENQTSQIKAGNATACPARLRIVEWLGLHRDTNAAAGAFGFSGIKDKNIF